MSHAAGEKPSRQLDLTFAVDSTGRTYVAGKHYRYPFHFTRPHYLETDPRGMARVVVQSSSGGIFARDDLQQSMTLHDGSQLHLTTQGSTVVHAMAEGECARQSLQLAVGARCLIEYFPGLAVLLQGAAFRQRLELRADRSAAAVIADGFLQHDPTDRAADCAWLESELIVRDSEEKILVRDRFSLSGAAFKGRLAAGGASFTAYGSIAAILPKPFVSRGVGGLVAQLADALDRIGGLYAGVSLLPNDAGIAVRLLGQDAQALREGVTQVWCLLRHRLTGHRPGASVSHPLLLQESESFPTTSGSPAQSHLNEIDR